MRSALSSVVLVAITCIAAAAPAAPPLVTNSVPVQGRGTLTWTVPATWESADPGQTVRSPSAPVTLRFRAPGNHPTVLLAVFGGGGEGKPAPMAEVFPVLVKALAEKKYAAESVEKAAKVVTAKGDAVVATYASFTDPKFATKEPPADETRNITVGMFRTGELWGNFTLLTNDQDGDEFQQAMAVVKSLRATEPPK